MLEPYNVRLAQAFNGDFTDPAHPQGYRRVLVTGFGDVEIKGSDERFCGGPNDTSKEFTLTGTMAKDGKSLTIDFSPKGGPTDLLAKKVFKNGVTGHERLDAAEYKPRTSSAKQPLAPRETPQGGLHSADPHRHSLYAMRMRDERTLRVTARHTVPPHSFPVLARLEFPDGNVWSKVYYGPMTQRLLDAHGPI